MSDNKKVVSSIEEQIARISNNFESDVLRLIKTQSMIKSSEEIINDEVQFLKTNIELIGSKIDEISIKTSEINELLQLSAEYKEHSSAHIERNLNDYLNTLTVHNNELNTLKNNLEERLSTGTESLKSLQKYYIAELKAFQEEVDSNLGIFKDQLKESIDSQANNNNHKNETVELETVVDQSTKNNGSNEPETLEKPEQKEVPSEPIKASEPTRKKEQGYKYNGEPERLKGEFERYKESFSKQKTRDPYTKKAGTEDLYHQKMFSSSIPRRSRTKSADLRKYVVISILIVWVLAVCGFYFYFLKKDEIKSANSSEFQNRAFYNEEFSNNDYMASNNGFGEDTSESALISPLENNYDGNVEPTLENNNVNEVFEDYSLPDSDIEETELPEKEEIATLPVYDYSVIVKKANIRMGPGKNYSIINTLSFGQQLQSLNETKGVWIKIKSEDGDIGWIGKRLILKN